MSSTPREIGTLIVVILKARHLPNKRHIGKQDPYCSVYHNGEKRRTKAIKRGGQHPEWDEEVRFTLYEDTEPEQLADSDGIPPPPPPKNEKASRKIKGGKNMKVACFADDPREPDLIGEAMVDLTEVLTKGETDEWFSLMNKEKYSGEVYLELTFWSNEPAPQKKIMSRAPPANRQYGGPGSFTPLADESQTGLYPGQRVSSMSSLPQHGRQVSDSYPVMRTSSSLAQLDLYVAPYERRKSPYGEVVNQVTDDFGALNVHDGRRRESLPPPSFAGRPTSVASTSSSSISQSFNDRPITPNAAPNVMPHPPVARSARYSIPTSSSGFAPMPTGSSFSSITSQLAEQQLNYIPPPLPPTPQIPMYNGNHSQTSLFSPIPPATPSIPPSLSYHQQNHDMHQYYSHSPSVSSQYQPPIPQQAPQQYTGYGPTPSPPREQMNYPPHTPGPPQLTASGSRPLPQPQGPPQVQPLGPSPSRVNLHSYSPSHSQSQTAFPVSPIPPPPPLLQTGNGSGSYTGEIHSAGALSILPPPPPLPPSVMNARPRRHSSLPQPPANITYHHPISGYGSIPPPPPPPGPIGAGLPPTPSSASFTNYYPGPPRAQLPTPPGSQYQLAQHSWQ